MKSLSDATPVVDATIVALRAAMRGAADDQTVIALVEMIEMGLAGVGAAASAGEDVVSGVPAMRGAVTSAVPVGMMKAVVATAVRSVAADTAERTAGVVVAMGVTAIVVIVTAGAMSVALVGMMRDVVDTAERTAGVVVAMGVTAIVVIVTAVAMSVALVGMMRDVVVIGGTTAAVVAVMAATGTVVTVTVIAGRDGRATGAVFGPTQREAVPDGASGMRMTAPIVRGRPASPSRRSLSTSRPSPSTGLLAVNC